MKRKKTNGVVFHRAEVYTGDDYHFIIMRNGDIKSLVPVSDVAWHACKYNQTTIGIAVFGDFASSEPGLNWHPTEAQIEAVITLVQSIKKLYRGPLWGAGHSELGHDGTVIPKKLVPGHTCPGENFPLLEVIIESYLIPFTKTESAPNLIV